MLSNVISTTMGLLLYSSIPNALSSVILTLKVYRRVIVQHMQNIRYLTHAAISQIHNSSRIVGFNRNNWIGASIRNKPRCEVLEEGLSTNNIKCCVLPATVLIEAQSSISINIPTIHMAHEFLWELWSGTYFCLVLNNAKSFSSANQFLRRDDKSCHCKASTIARFSDRLFDWMIRLNSISKAFHVDKINNRKRYTYTRSASTSRRFAITHETISQQKANPIRSFFVQWLIKVCMIALIGTMKFRGILTPWYLSCHEQSPDVCLAHSKSLAERHGAFASNVSLAYLFSLFFSQCEWFISHLFPSPSKSNMDIISHGYSLVNMEVALW
jgi:hypothetical protein